MVADTKRARDRATVEAVVQGVIASHDASVAPVAVGH
jgi:hypothetical protein